MSCSANGSPSIEEGVVSGGMREGVVSGNMREGKLEGLNVDTLYNCTVTSNVTGGGVSYYVQSATVITFTYPNCECVSVANFENL